MGNRRIQQNINQTTIADHQKKRHHTTITGSKLVETTANNNKQNFIGQQNRPIRKHTQEVAQTLRYQPHNKERRIQSTNKTGMLPNTTKSTTNTLLLTRRRKIRTEPTSRIRTFGEIRNYRRRLLRGTRGNYGKKEQIRQNRFRCKKTK